jgi:hypothetical protein
MKIVVVGGTGLVGFKVGKHRHEAVPASPASSLIMLLTVLKKGLGQRLRRQGQQ